MLLQKVIWSLWSKLVKQACMSDKASERKHADLMVEGGGGNKSWGIQWVGSDTNIYIILLFPYIFTHPLM